MREQWRDIPELVGWYQVSNRGNVRRSRPGRSTYRWRKCALCVGVNGYVSVYLRKNGKQIKRLAHRLVAEAFIGPCPVGKEVNHKDLNRQNNFLENLEYLTRSQNNLHSIRAGVLWAGRGERQGCAKLTADKVREIRKLRSLGVLLADIAEQFGVADRTICSVVNYQTWRHIA